MNQPESNQVQLGETIVSTFSSSSKNTPSTTISCTSCQKQLEGNFARALDGAFHWECFLCIVSY